MVPTKGSYFCQNLDWSVLARPPGYTESAATQQKASSPPACWIHQSSPMRPLDRGPQRCGPLPEERRKRYWDGLGYNTGEQTVEKWGWAFLWVLKTEGAIGLPMLYGPSVCKTSYIIWGFHLFPLNFFSGHLLSHSMYTISADTHMFINIPQTVMFCNWTKVQLSLKASYLEIKCFITVENKDKPSKLMPKSLNGFCFTSSCRTCL